MTLRLGFLIVLGLLFTLATQAQSPYSHQLQIINQEMTAAWQHHDIAGLLRNYADEAVSMPEYHQTLFGKKAIAHYLGLWMDSATTDSYTRQTHDLTQAGQYIIETGTFNNRFTLQKKVVNYAGKYLNIWQIKPDGSLKLLSEITGADHYVERSDLPLSNLQIPDTARLPKPFVNGTMLAIQVLNEEISALIIARRGKDFAQYYTDDAIYMPYDVPMKIGKADIDAYYREHEDPNTRIDWVHIGPTLMIDAGDYVLANNYYIVNWRGGSSHGTVTGKNISVWKRDNSGHLLIYRQMAVHD